MELARKRIHRRDAEDAEKRKDRKGSAGPQMAQIFADCKCMDLICENLRNLRINLFFCFSAFSASLR
jgi:hypothetical protein